MNMSLKKLTSIPAVLFMLMIAIGVQARCQTVSESSDAELAIQPIDTVSAMCSKSQQEAIYVSSTLLNSPSTRLDVVNHCNSPSAPGTTAWFAFFGAPSTGLAKIVFRNTVDVCKRYKGIPITNTSSQIVVIQCSYTHVE
jgi:hypothetical protein